MIHPEPFEQIQEPVQIFFEEFPLVQLFFQTHFALVGSVEFRLPEKLLDLQAHRTRYFFILLGNDIADLIFFFCSFP